MARQRSLEAEGHGIFTQHLLELLQCDDPKVFADVEVDLFDLYEVLRKRVSHTASELFGDAQQDPFANFSKRTGVVLRVLTERKRRYLRALLNCLVPTPAQPARVIHSQRRRIERRLRDHVEGGERVDGFQSFYDFFDEGLRGTDPDDIVAVEADCRDLLKYFDEATNSASQPQAQGAPRAPSPPRPGSLADSSPTALREDRAPAAAAVSLDSTAAPTSATLLLGGAVPVTPLAVSSEDRRVLAEDDCAYVLGNILQDPRLFREAGLLRQLLTRADGVSRADVTTWLIGTVPKMALPDWESMKDEIAARFMEKFPHARKVARVNAVSLRANRGN